MNSIQIPILTLQWKLALWDLGFALCNVTIQAYMTAASQIYSQNETSRAITQHSLATFPVALFSES